MRANSLLAGLLLAACQTGEAPRVQPGAKVREAMPVVAPQSASGITPMQMIASEAAPVTEVAAPFTLTASDGSGLALTRLDAKAVVRAYR